MECLLDERGSLAGVIDEGLGAMKNKAIQHVRKAIQQKQHIIQFKSNQRTTSKSLL